MKSVCFAVTLVSGEQKAVAVSDSKVAFLDMAQKARSEGKVLIDGEAVPILGGSVFSNLPVEQPYIFKCQPATLGGGKRR